MKRTRGWRRALFVSGGLAAVMVGGFFASPAGAHGDTSKFQDKNYKVEYSAPVFADGKTTFKITLSGTEEASHVLVVPCGSPTLVSASGPDGAGTPVTGQDGSTGHTGTKFPKGPMGEYTIVYEGQVSGLDFIVKNGDGHQHFAVESCTTQTTTPPSTQNTPTSSTPTSSTDSSTPDSSSPPSSQPSQSGTDVGGTKQSQPGTTVLGEQLTQPETQPATLGNTLPRTGLPVPALVSMGTMLLALGGVATALGRRPRG